MGHFHTNISCEEVVGPHSTQTSAAKKLVHSTFKQRQAGYIYKMGISIIALSAVMSLCAVVFARSPLTQTNLELKSNVNIAMDKYSNEDIPTRQAREAQSFLGALWNGIAGREQALLDPETGAPLTEARERELCRGIEGPCEIGQITHFGLFGNTQETRVGSPCPFRSRTLCNQWGRRV